MIVLLLEMEFYLLDSNSKAGRKSIVIKFREEIQKKNRKKNGISYRMNIFSDILCIYYDIGKKKFVFFREEIIQIRLQPNKEAKQQQRRKLCLLRDFGA